EVGRSERRPQLLDDAPAEGAEHASERAVDLETAHVVGADRDDLAPPGDLVRPVRRRLARSGTALRPAEDVRVQQGPGHGQRADAEVRGYDDRNLLLLRIPGHGQSDRAAHDALEHVDAVAL